MPIFKGEEIKQSHRALGGVILEFCLTQISTVETARSQPWNIYMLQKHCCDINLHVNKIFLWGRIMDASIFFFMLFCIFQAFYN